jgi:iron complex outermembrane receptor protein
VHKSSQASLVEGGVAGSVDIVTRKPLDFSSR